MLRFMENSQVRKLANFQKSEDSKIKGFTSYIINLISIKSKDLKFRDVEILKHETKN